ncbi:MAG: hypothetical protein ABSE51_22705 [Terracidiphilus sp.]|jgi:hypothetical protein
MARNEEVGSKVRVTLDLPEPFHRRLMALEQLTHTSRADVIRHALQIYEFVAKKSLLEGYKFYSVDKSGEQERLAFFSPYAAELDLENKNKEEETSLVG